MKTYTYTHPKEIESTTEVPILNDDGQVIAISKRIYDNRLKKALDHFFDYRYFLKYDILNSSRDKAFSIKKISRKGKLWYEGYDIKSTKKYIITYENWRIGIPELTITDGTIKIQIDKQMEDWSEYLFNGNLIARWKAELINDEFYMTLQIDENSPIQNVDFYIAISQATLFVGA